MAVPSDNLVLKICFKLPDYAAIFWQATKYNSTRTYQKVAWISRVVTFGLIPESRTKSSGEAAGRWRGVWPRRRAGSARSLRRRSIAAKLLVITLYSPLLLRYLCECNAVNSLSHFLTLTRVQFIKGCPSKRTTNFNESEPGVHRSAYISFRFSILCDRDLIKLTACAVLKEVVELLVILDDEVYEHGRDWKIIYTKRQNKCFLKNLWN